MHASGRLHHRARSSLHFTLASLALFAALGPSRAVAAQTNQATQATRDTIRLTVADARDKAIESNPELRAARLGMRVAAGELRQASLYIPSNPTADLLTRGEGTEIGLTQEIEIAGQRGARRAAGLAGTDRARAEVLDAARLSLGDVERAFYRLAAAEQRLNLASEVLRLNERLTDAANKQLTAGEISRLEYNLAAVELGRSQSRLLAAERARAEAAGELRPLLGLVPPTVIVPVVELPRAVAQPNDDPEFSAAADSTRRRAGVVGASWRPAAHVTLNVDSLMVVALARRPDLLERDAAARQFRAQASVARREAMPNLALRVSSERVDGVGRVLRPGIGFTLPAFNRNQGEVEARRAEAAQAELDRAGLVVRIRSSVARAAAAYETALAETEVLERTVLGPARENRQLLELAYQSGKVALPVLLLIRNQVIEAEGEYWDAWLAEREALADLAEITGENIQTDLRRLLGEAR